MSVRMDDRELDMLLADWFDEGPNTAAGFVVERALERVPNVRRSGASWWPQLPRLLHNQKEQHNVQLDPTHDSTEAMSQRLKKQRIRHEYKQRQQRNRRPPHDPVGSGQFN